MKQKESSREPRMQMVTESGRHREQKKQAQESTNQQTKAAPNAK
jgi:hypothetical protein